MIYLKKLALSPVFLILLSALILKLPEVLNSYNILFSLSLEGLYLLVTIVGLITMTAIAFTIFVTIASDWKVTAPVILIASALPLIFLPYSLGLILSIGILISLFANAAVLENKLQSYIDFKPTDLLTPIIKGVVTLLILLIALGYYLSINKQISEEGFEIPDSLLELSTNFSSSSPYNTDQYQLPPELLNTASQQIQTSTKSLLKEQLNLMLKPYQGYIAPLFAVFLFFSLLSFSSILGIFIRPVIYLIFYLFRKTGFISFTTEMREVKKLIV